MKECEGVCVCECDDFDQTCVCVFMWKMVYVVGDEQWFAVSDNLERRCIIDCGVWNNGLPSCAVEPEGR